MNIRRYVRALALAALAMSGTVAATSGAPQTPAAQSDGPPRFRAGVDVISLDVQVVDSDGHPVTTLTPDDFEVTIGGRRRRVVSVDFIDVRPTGERVASVVSPAISSSTTTVAGAAVPGTTPAARRVYVLAIDTASFDESTARPVLVAATDFLKQLQPHDEVGVFAYPNGPKLDPTTDHDAVVRTLETVRAVRETAPIGRFNLAPSHVIEMSRRPTTGYAEELFAAFCPPDGPPECRDLLESQIRSEVLFYEGVASAGSATLRALMAALGEVTERKTVVIVSGGVVAADFVGARPDVGTLFRDLGRVAAQSNVNVYTLFVDQSWTRSMAAESRTMRAMPNVTRERELAARVLAELSDAAGGALLSVSTGNGSTAFARVVRESAAYYLLGVEPVDGDRAGRARELRVRVRDRRLNVRGRSWIGVPGPSVERVAAATSTPSSAPPPSPTPSLPPVTDDVRELAAMFNRDDQAAMAQALAPSNASRLLRAFREHESPWPDSPRRTAAFALDLAMMGVRADSIYTREEALRLLGEYLVRVRQDSPDDTFECTWLRTATAGAAGLFAPELGTLVAERAVERCRADAGLQLARAVAHDQQLVRAQRQFGPSPELSDDPAELERHVLDLYERAATFPGARFEAAVRMAQLHFRAGRHEAGLTSLAAAGPAPADPVLHYYAHLIRGQLLEAAGRLDESVSALRTALEIAPTAQSARVASMSVLIRQGRADEAARVADSVLAAEPGTIVDPWWAYYLGDFRDYDAIRARLRQAAP